MAKLGALPAQAIISGFKSVIDFYVRDGVAIARRWPRPRTTGFNAQERAQWPIFADAVSLWNTLDPDVRASYNTMASGSSLSGRDMMIKMYINGKSILLY